ncbi:MAG: hypothetical protein AMXMBFR7_23010 [Planctomycetota bacterium]
MEAIAEVSTGKLDGSYTKVEYRLTETVYGKSRYGPVVHNFLITLLSVVFFAITIEYVLRNTSARANAKPAKGPAPRKETGK